MRVCDERLFAREAEPVAGALGLERDPFGVMARG